MSADRTVLVAHDVSSDRAELVAWLAQAGFDAVPVAGGQAALAELAARRPALLLLELMSGEPDGHAVLMQARRRPEFADMRVIALLQPGSSPDVGKIFERGADDYVEEPVRRAELVARVREQLRRRDASGRLGRREAQLESVLELTQKLASTLDVRDILYTVVKRLAEIARGDRCSIVLLGEGGKVGYVLATSDDADLRDLPIDLGKYPEIREVLASRRTLLIQDTHQHPLLEVALQAEPNIDFHSLAIVPILDEQGPIGVLFLRARAKDRFLEPELSMFGMVANAAAIALRNARILEGLRAETEQSAVARVEAERRVRFFQRYADFFENAADGMIVIDRTGGILFTNPRALEVTGYATVDLVGQSFLRLLDTREHESAEQLLTGFAQGVYPRSFDLRLRTRAQERLIANVSSSSVLRDEDAILLTLRDVTQERRTAIELTRTKEFLESVIDSSVDGIVSADLRGTVLLFNRAAARIFGYSPADVLGKLRVDRLYPPGVARDVMRKIRDPALSGDGRLADYRVDMLAADGRTIQVLLSASLVVDNGRPIGSVGIFTDIRDKLRMEAELGRAQDELREREKQAIVAELAGAAAHELNQPLTSVIGYAELLRRRLAGDPACQAPLGVIVDEAQRMAEIVRQVGRITRYETKSYVGQAKILDLEKASSDDPAAEGSPG